MECVNPAGHWAPMVKSRLEIPSGQTVWMITRRCAYCAKDISLGKANDDLAAVKDEIRAVELAEIASHPDWQMPMGFSGPEDRGWYDRERSPTSSVWPISDAGWLAHAIVHHEAEARLTSPCTNGPSHADPEVPKLPPRDPGHRVFLEVDKITIIAALKSVRGVLERASMEDRLAVVNEELAKLDAEDELRISCVVPDPRTRTRTLNMEEIRSIASAIDGWTEEKAREFYEHEGRYSCAVCEGDYTLIDGYDACPLCNDCCARVGDLFVPVVERMNVLECLLHEALTLVSEAIQYGSTSRVMSHLAKLRSLVG